MQFLQVKYQDAGMVSSTLLLELQPWCFVMNALGCEVTIVAEDIELCQVPHHGIITPPKLEVSISLRHPSMNIETLHATSELFILIHYIT